MFTTHKFDTFMRLYRQLIHMDADLSCTIQESYDDMLTADQQAAAKVKTDALAYQISEMENRITHETGVGNANGNIRIVGSALETLLYNPGEDE